MALCFGLEDLKIARYTDADFARDIDDRKSTSGYIFRGTTISWLSKKQNYVAKSTMKA
jgi:hypothetical protein